MTEKLYDADSHLREFSARVISCEKDGEHWTVTLDRTAFFPEGGGQAADTGTLGEARVLDVQEVSGEILHHTDTPLPAGEIVRGRLNWEQRFRRMQNHSGEHILSGLVHARYGYRNVGFHLGDGDVTVDFDGELTRAQLEELETAVNVAIAENRTVTCWYPPKEELATLDHVSRTGEIGSMHILDHMRHRGGVRLHMLCGLDAMEDARARYQATLAISGLLSVPQLDTPSAVRRVLGELEETKQALGDARRQLLQMKAAALRETEGDRCLFEPELDMLSLRELVNLGMERTGGICAAFAGRDGDWKYIIGSRTCDLRTKAKEINAAIGGRGGGRPEMIQGSCTATRQQIEAYFHG